MKRGILFPEAVFLMDKLVYALNLIVDFIDVNDHVNERELTDYLFFTGFDDYEVRQILALLGIKGASSPESFRIFSRTEKQLFASDALNYLDKLLISGVLDFAAAEEVIERAETMESYKITVEQIKELTLLILLEKRADVYGASKAADDYVQ